MICSSPDERIITVISKCEYSFRRAVLSAGIIMFREIIAAKTARQATKNKKKTAAEGVLKHAETGWRRKKGHMEKHDFWGSDI